MNTYGLGVRGGLAVSLAVLVRGGGAVFLAEGAALTVEGLIGERGQRGG